MSDDTNKNIVPQSSPDKKKSRKKRKPTKYNLFMKKEMTKIKKSNPKFTQQQVMKRSAENWRKQK